MSQKKEYNKLENKLKMVLADIKYFKNKYINAQTELDGIKNISQENIKKDIIINLPPTAKFLDNEYVTIYISGYNYNEGNDKVSELTLKCIVINNEDIVKDIKNMEIE